MAIIDEIFGGQAPVDPEAIQTLLQKLALVQSRQNEITTTGPAGPPKLPPQAQPDGVAEAQALNQSVIDRAAASRGQSQPAPAPAVDKAARPAPGAMEQIGAFLSGGNQGDGLLGAIGAGLSNVNKLGRQAEVENMTFGALVKKGMDPEVAKAVVANPTLLQQVAPVIFGPKSGGDFGVIGQNAMGQNQYGFIDKINRSVTPLGKAGGQASTDGVNTDVTGEDFLKQLDPNIASQVKGIVEGRMQPPGSFALKSPYWQQMMSYAAQYEPGFDFTKWGARAATAKDFGSGKSAQNITSFNTAIQHLETLDNAANDLNNVSLPFSSAARKLTNPIAAQASPDAQARLKKFDQAATALSEELTRAFRGTGGNVHDIVEWRKSFDAADAPEAMSAAVQQAAELLNGRIEALQAQYDKGMGRDKSDPLPGLSPKAASALMRFREQQAAPAAKPAGGGTTGGYKVLGVR